jgi:hypothetical protein
MVSTACRTGPSPCFEQSAARLLAVTPDALDVSFH